MKTLCIDIADKIATYRKRTGAIICGNNDYQVKFTFDSDWDAYTKKTARFIWNGQYVDVDFTGNVCPAPMIQNTEQVSVGVYAGDLCTTTPAVIDCKKSILCSGVPASDEMREQYVDEAKAAADRAEDAAERAEEAAERAEAGGGGGGGGGGITPHIGENGNWWIGKTDTGVKAEGKDGITPHIGANGNWWIGEDDTGVKAEGKDGFSPTVEVSELKETITYTQADGLVAIPEGARFIEVAGTCSGYMSGGKVYFVIADSGRSIISSVSIGSGDDSFYLEVYEFMEVPDNAAYIGTYPFLDEWFDDNRNNGYSCDLSVKFSDFEQDGVTLSITDVNGTKSVNLYNGGAGYSPVRGKDYWTEADKAEIKSYVDNAILGGAW